ncbi:Gfo/Idh/MocA family protein [Paenibacillus eucommiae]|uniref:Dehydrogenase n=1 Tax=Paenibacillus eucommiae TaxID=1355755 RepID=A0ABS4J3V7_9BACL|nr:Gfo/Idh/MocA family oxidoreductase [Paenibacillus eucommiae]MBP1994503.1 putative dehydrogenase [Paenibacillus eucommiae]
MTNVGVIGYGVQIRRLLTILQEQDPACKITAIADVRYVEIQQNLLLEGVDISGIRFYSSADDMLASGGLDGVCVGTRCSQHTPMAIKVLAAGIPLYLEKPVATTMDDLVKLRDAYRKSNSQVIVSFPLRVTSHVRLVKEIIDSGKIGTVEHIQAVNNVPYGSIYFHGWYRDEMETGGLFLQKATHDFDYINYVLGSTPVLVSAMTSNRIFKGDKPAGLKCADCTEQETCPESPQNLSLAGENRFGDYCGFAVDTGNEDSGSALLQYESGMHASYSQNFFVRKKAAQRGARFMGYKGTVEFDWYTDEVKVYMHHTPRVETYSIDSAAIAGGHGGGDYALMRNFAAIMQGKTDVSVAPLEAGLSSVLVCLKAKQSAETSTFQAIQWPREEG